MTKTKINATQLCRFCDLAQTFNQKRIVLVVEIVFEREKTV